MRAFLGPQAKDPLLPGYPTPGLPGLAVVPKVPKRMEQLRYNRQPEEVVRGELAMGWGNRR